MDKNGELTSKSPCAFCGAPSVDVRDGHPVCPIHDRKPKEAPMAEVNTKVAVILTDIHTHAG